MTEDSTVSYDTDGPVAVITIERPAARNAVNRPTAQALAAVGGVRRFGDPRRAVGVSTTLEQLPGSPFQLRVAQASTPLAPLRGSSPGG